MILYYQLYNPKCKILYSELYNLEYKVKKCILL